MSNKSGQSLIELLVIIGLAVILLPAILSGMIFSRSGKVQEQNRLQAVGLIRELKDSVASVRESGWQHITVNGIYHAEINNGSWILVGGPETVGNLTRQLSVNDVFRDTVIDPSSKLINYSVSWGTGSGGSVEESEFLTRYLGNQTITQTSQADFAFGQNNNTQVTADGKVELKPLTSTAIFTDDYLNSSDYDFDANKIEVSTGYAQLKNLGSPMNNSTLNPGFDINANNWTFAKYNGNASQTGSFVSTGGNPGGFININFPVNRSKIAGGYYYQSFTTTTNNISAALTFNWKVVAYQAAPNSFHLYAWLDTGTGTPATQVWDSGNISSTTNWSGTVTVNVSPHLITAGTYNIKVGADINYNNNTNLGPYTVGFDNVLLSWSGTGTSYASDSPAISENNSFHPTQLLSWDSFSATEIPNGGSVKYQLSHDNGTSWQFWNNSWTNVTQTTDYNDALTINSHIINFATASGQIKVKAILVGNGTQQVKLDKITIGYTGSGGSNGPNSGNFISNVMDTRSLSSFNRMIWTETNTANTTTKLQIAVNNDNSTWNFAGPDATSATYFTGGSATVPLSLVSGRYLKYQIFFTSTNTDLPNIADFTVNYSP